MRILLTVFLITVMLFSSATPREAFAMAEWIQNPATGEYWYCDYYGSEYWCYLSDSGFWTRAAPNWQYGALGG